jgi:hypothetical protein
MAGLFAVVLTLVLVEVGACALVETGMVVAPRPRDGRTAYWRGDHPDFGVWHVPGLEFEHRSACFDVRYSSNSVGARDVERRRRSDRPRVVVLGDSFLEGWGLPRVHRLSNRLEAETGIPHLNFAMAHFGPYQEYLVYRELAQQFDHDAVIVGVTPANDFLDTDLELARAQGYYRFRFRPYLVGDPADLRHIHHREPRWRYWLRRWTYTGSALVATAERRALAQAGSEFSDRPWFYDYGIRQVRVLEAILARIANEATGKRVLVVLIPTLSDLQSRARMGAPPLATRLARAGKTEGYEVLDLLSAMAKHSRQWDRYYLPCDYHWSAFGNEVASEYVLQALAPDLYREPNR